MKKYYHVELNQQEAELFKVFLKENNIYFEPSNCYNLVHFAVKCNLEEVKKVNDFLDTLQ